ncbi:unnamed protein product, partial [Laminaria digitata]
SSDSSSGRKISRNFPFFRRKYKALKMTTAAASAASSSADDIELLHTAAAAPPPPPPPPPPAPAPRLEERWLCGRALAALRFAKSTASMVLIFVAGCAAVLVTFWSLFPVCTSCMLRSHSLRQDISTPSNETGWSTLYINQLQVGG